jgi:5-methylcytosine-specific restriction protein B
VNRPTISVGFAGRGRQATLPWIAMLDRRETRTTQDGVYCVYLFREDLSGVYLTFAVGVTQPRRRFGSDTSAFRNHVKARVAELKGYADDLTDAGFSFNGAIDLRATRQRGKDYELATVAHRLYESNAVPDDAVLTNDLESVLSAYDKYLVDKLRTSNHPPASPTPLRDLDVADEPFDLEKAVEQLVRAIERERYVFEPWQIAANVAALRTKPLVILAGVTGTGKSTLPRLVAEATGGATELIPVRPDWTDSSDVLGYTDLRGAFRPGVILELARHAMLTSDTHLTCVLDEMNLARVEQYLAEILSRIEDRRPSPTRGFQTPPLLASNVGEADWAKVVLPFNFALVGTVNMDESAHGFSRKVLDRAFTLELSEIDMERWEDRGDSASTDVVTRWPAWAWSPRSTRLATLSNVTEDDRRDIQRVIAVLSTMNTFLTAAQLQVGYRTRDEIALFVLHSREILSSFRTSTNDPVDPLDLALHMKVLPRIIGGSAAIRTTIIQLLGWATDGVPRQSEEGLDSIMSQWRAAGRPNALPQAKYPSTASRLCLMWARVVAEGFTSFWL